jgi:hypothetical protein
MQSTPASRHENKACGPANPGETFLIYSYRNFYRPQGSAMFSLTRATAPMFLPRLPPLKAFCSKAVLTASSAG